MLLAIHQDSGTKTDVTSHIAEGGYKVTLSDLDNNSGRTLDGKMWREYVCRKVKLSVTFKDEVPTAVCSAILSAVKRVYFTLDYFDPSTGKMETSEFYNTEKIATCMVQRNGNEYWSGITLSLIER